MSELKDQVIYPVVWERAGGTGEHRNMTRVAGPICGAPCLPVSAVVELVVQFRDVIGADTMFPERLIENLDALAKQRIDELRALTSQTEDG